MCPLFWVAKKVPLFFYKGCASRQLAWQYPAAWVQQNSPFLNPAIPSSFFLIRPFPTNLNPSFFCPRPADLRWQIKRRLAVPGTVFIQLTFFSASPCGFRPGEVSQDAILAFFNRLVPAVGAGTAFLGFLQLFSFFLLFYLSLSLFLSLASAPQGGQLEPDGTLRTVK